MIGPVVCAQLANWRNEIYPCKDVWKLCGTRHASLEKFCFPFFFRKRNLKVPRIARRQLSWALFMQCSPTYQLQSPSKLRMATEIGMGLNIRKISRVSVNLHRTPVQGILGNHFYRPTSVFWGGVNAFHTSQPRTSIPLMRWLCAPCQSPYCAH